MVLVGVTLPLAGISIVEICAEDTPIAVLAGSGRVQYSTATEMEPLGQSSQTRARILVVDDFEIVRRGLTNLLNGSKSWQVCGEAENGRMAVEQVAALAPDIVFLDVSMPGMNGFEAAREIRKIAPRTKIVIFTMHESSQVAEEARLAGADTYLAKSSSIEVLEGTIQSLLASRPSPLA